MIRTRLSRMFVAGLAGLAVFAVTASAHAFQIFTDRTAWENAVAASPLAGPIVDDPFDNPIANAASITFDSGVVSTGTPASARADNSVNPFGQYVGNVRGNVFDSVFFDIITWGFPMPIFAFGADWFSTASRDGLTVTGDFDGNGDATVSFFDELGDPGTGFLGVVGDAAFSMIALEGEGLSAGVNESFSVDNLSFAKASDATAVPEPAGIAVFGMGLAGLAWRRRRTSPIKRLRSRPTRRCGSGRSR